MMRGRLLFALLLLTAAPCRAATRYVALDGRHLAPFASWTYAATNIQAAIDEAYDGDTIVVGDGVFAGSGNQSVVFRGKRIAVISLHGPEQTRVNGGFVFQNGETSASQVSGFTFSNNGAAVSCSGGSPTIEYCVLRPGTVSCSGASPILRRCTISGNGGQTVLDLSGSSPVLENCLIADNGGTAIYAYSYSSPVLRNCTLAGNETAISTKIYSNPQLVNTIVWSNSASVTGPGGTTGRYCCVQGGLVGEGNIAADPQFAGVGDYRLRPSSPCIDAGTTGPLVDLAGGPRPMDGNNDGAAATDIGAYEYDGLLTLTVRGDPVEAGTPWPRGYGAHRLPVGTLVINYAAGNPAGPATNAPACVGWTASGSIAGSGTNTGVAFLLTTNTTLTWRWPSAGGTNGP